LTLDDATFDHQTCVCCKYCNITLCNNMMERRNAMISGELTREEEHVRSCGGTLIRSGKYHLDNWVAFYPLSEQMQLYPHRSGPDKRMHHQ
jgi:hypothetical protein